MTAELQSDVLARLREEGGAELIAALAALLARTAPARLALIAHGLATDDRAAVVRAAHSLQSSAANLGARELSKAAIVEHLAETADGWLDRDACEIAAAEVNACWADVADSVRRLAAAHVEAP